MGCAFDQWQKDAFFPAAEAVQESADILESAYRMWMRERSEGFNSEDSDEVCRDLRTALGTAKWQLEEFERAVNASHDNCSSEDNRGRAARHRHFVAAIENQISRVEKVLGDSFADDGKQPLRWVQLDDQERDDLALFLSTTLPSTQKTIEHVSADIGPVKGIPSPDWVKGFRGTVTVKSDSKFVVELEANDSSKAKNKACDEGEWIEGQSRSWSSPDINSWKIVIADEEEAKRKLLESQISSPSHSNTLCGIMKNAGMTIKSRLSRSNFQKEKSEEQLRIKQRISGYLDLRAVARFVQGRYISNERNQIPSSNCNADLEASNVSQIYGRVGGIKRQIQTSQYYMQFSRSLRITFLLVLTIFMIVPFVFYSG